MHLRIATATGLLDDRSGALPRGPARVFGDALIVGDRRLFWFSDGAWVDIGEAPGLRCAVDAPGGLVVGTEGAHLLRRRAGGLTRIESFETVEGREDWYTPWGGPPEVRSLACTADNVLLANVHVGGIVRSDDSGRTWQPTIDLHFDVHHVRSIWGRSDLVVAAAAVGLCVSSDAGRTWRVRAEGLDVTYCRAVAVPDEAILVSASEGPRGRHAAIFRTSIHGDTPFERVTEWMTGNIDTGALDGYGEHAVFGTAGGEVWQSSDSGATWTRTHEGLAPVTGVSVLP
ncbi:MAG: WD40/YVTN/BNR-like repeat-containing protein [Acidimicrobiia bacterium]